MPVYWIVNVIDRQIEVHTQPSGTGSQASYATVMVVARDATVPVVIAGVELGRFAVGDILVAGPEDRL